MCIRDSSRDMLAGRTHIHTQTGRNTPLPYTGADRVGVKKLLKDADRALAVMKDAAEYVLIINGIILDTARCRHNIGPGLNYYDEFCSVAIRY